MIGTNKKRAVISYENMSPELAEVFKEKYPHGYADYMGDIFLRLSNRTVPLFMLFPLKSLMPFIL